MILELIHKNRSYRRFDKTESVSASTLRELIDLARYSPSAANRQPLKYILSSDTKKNERIFSHLSWAGYLKDWPGPDVLERPSAYIIILGDTRITKTFGCDYGIAAQSILLGAVEKGLGGCMICSIQRDGLRKDLAIPEHFQILMVIALGKPAECIILEDIGPEESIEYYRDPQDRHHVPKRKLEELIVAE